MQTECLWKNFIADYIDGELPKEVEILMEKHLCECSSCNQSYLIEATLLSQLDCSVHPVTASWQNMDNAICAESIA